MSHWHHSLTELLTPSAEELGSTQSVQEAENKHKYSWKDVANPCSLTLGLLRGAHKQALTLLSVRPTFHMDFSILSYTEI